MIFKSIPEEIQQLVEENDSDNTSKVRYKSFIWQFWELDWLVLL